MIYPPTARVVLTIALEHLLAIILVLIVSATVAFGQTTSSTDGTTLPGQAPGPAGSYGLTGLETVNLYNGNLDFHLPLVGVAGRGGAQTAFIMANVNTHWTVEYTPPDIPNGIPYSYDPNPDWWAPLLPGYGPGVLQGRKGKQFNTFLTRLTFTTSDGTEYELRDQLYGGQPKPAGTSRGTNFISADGSAMTFISDTAIAEGGSGFVVPSGYLLFADGTRYRIDSGVVSWSRDRNGNKLTFQYDASRRVTAITDSLNRQVGVSYADMVSIFYDQITFKGFGGAQRIIKVWHSSLSGCLRAGYTTQSYTQLFPGLQQGDGTLIYNPNNKVSAVDLPDGRRYQLYYNSWGELARVVLPTGGAIEYDYVEMGGGNQIQRRVAERRVYPDGSTLEGKQVYTATYGTNSTVVVEQRDPSNALKASEKYYFYGNPVPNVWTSALSYPAWKEGREYQTEVYDSNGTTLRRQSVSTWQQRAAVSWWTGAADSAPANDPRLSDTTTTLVDTNQVAKQTFSYDDSVPYNNQSDAYEYDFGPGAPGALVRRTHTDYITSTSYTDTNVHLRRLPTQIQVFDSAGAEKARTTYEYDNYASDGSHAPLTNRSLISGLDSSFTTSYQTRGNVTKTTNWVLQTSTQLNSYPRYDIAGNLVKAIDPRGYATNFYYADCFGTPNGEAHTNIAPTELASQSQTSYALLTSVTNHLGQTAYAQYDYYLGKAVDGEDMNGVVASGYYNDVLDRPTQVVRDALNLAAKSQMSFTYDDVNHIVTTKSDFSTFGDYLLRKDALYDGLGRTTETRGYETPTAYVTVRQTYDALGRTKQVSNPPSAPARRFFGLPMPMIRSAASLP